MVDAMKMLKDGLDFADLKKQTNKKTNFADLLDNLTSKMGYLITM